jgi:cell fate regulator YaaT (PSP1 superfamily)
MEESQGRQQIGKVGKGVPLHQLPGHRQLYMVEFKAGRTDLFYVDDPTGTVHIHTGDLVIVEADRGKDLGKVTVDNLTTQQVSMLQAQQQFEQQQQQQMVTDNEPAPSQRKDIHPKRIYRLAQPNEITSLVNKGEDEAKARLLCQNKVRQKKLPMEVVDAEYQWYSNATKGEGQHWFESEFNICF